MSESEFPVLVDGFMSVSDFSFCDEPELRWYCAPDSWFGNDDDSDNSDNSDTNKQSPKEEEEDDGKREGRDGSWSVDEDGQLVVAPPAKKDFWRKTYYSPLLIKDDGPCLFATVPKTKTIMATTSFTIQGQTRQFDQAGLLVRLDKDHWLKTGIEIVDGVPKLSCVCTNVYSDWSTQTYWKAAPEQVKLRLHILPERHAVVVEAWKEEEDDDNNNSGSDDGASWEFIRICHLSKRVLVNDDPLEDQKAVQQAWAGKAAPSGHLYVGVFAACPEDQSGSMAVTFHDLKIVEGSTFTETHNADGNFE